MKVRKGSRVLVGHQEKRLLDRVANRIETINQNRSSKNFSFTMKTLAELALEYLWLIIFAPEDVIDLDYSVKCQESLSEYFSALTTQEKEALSAVAVSTQARLLAEPDNDGYTPRSLATEEQIQFLSALASGKFFDQWA